MNSWLGARGEIKKSSLINLLSQKKKYIYIYLNYLDMGGLFESLKALFESLNFLAC